MKIRIISLIGGMLLFCASAAFGQGSCYPAGVVLLDTGRPANGATVRVCTAGSTGTPCTPAASLFTDPTLGTPLGGSPVVTTDSHGNFGFCAAAGANYDLQITGSGITPLNIKNLPLPPAAPIVANALTSSSANPANVGVVELASGDCLDWRNNANTGNIQLCKTTADVLDLTAFPAISNIVVNPSALGTNAALTVGGTSSTTGGISVFVGALGAATERASIVPADGNTAAFRVGSLSVRANNAGFLTGTENASISNAGAIVGTSATIGGIPVATTTGSQTLINKTYGDTTLNIQKFTSGGTFTIPANVTSVKITVVGSGAAGGGTSGTASSNGSGGGSGGSAIKWLTGLTPGNTLTVTVGAGGTGVSNANGNNGTASSVASGTQTITTITVNGGNGGIANGSQPGGGAAVGSGGDINNGGNPGGFGATTNVGGNGGSSIFGGAGAFGLAGAGGAATAPGAGGGGAGGSAAAAAGGAGAAGIVIFEWVN